MELPARVKYPAKRITTGEMRKRVKNVLEYVGRVQIEEGKRRERAETLGIDAKPLPIKVKRKAVQREEIADSVNVNGQVSARDDVEMEEAIEPPATENGEGSETLADKEHSADEQEPPEGQIEKEEDAEELVEKITTRKGPTSGQLLDELTRDLIAFQETWAAGGFATPVPPWSTTFSNGNGNGNSNGDYPSSGLAREFGASEIGDEEGDGVGEEEREEKGERGDGLEGDEGGAQTALGLGITNGDADGGMAGGGEATSGSEVTRTAEDDGSAEMPEGEEKQVIKVTEEPVDVYREGEILKVVSDIAEDQAHGIVEKQAETEAAIEAEVEAKVEAVEAV